MSEQHVAFCCGGEKGIRHLAVAVLSLHGTHSRPESLRFHIVWEGLSDTALEDLKQGWAAFSEQVSFYQAGDYLQEQAKGPQAGYWFRTYLGDILPSEIDRVLYLDYDILVLRDVSPMWDFDISNHAAAVVWDSASSRLDFPGQLAREAREMGADFNPNQPCFNSGVLFINLNRWRELSVGKTLAGRFGRFRQHYKSFHDQNELNILLQSEILPLPPSWNLQEDLWRYTNWSYELYEDLGPPKEYFNPYIRHFTGGEKADGRWRRASSKDLYYKYIDMTPWKGYRSEADRSRLNRLIAEFLDFHYLVCRGLLQNSLESYLPEMARLVCSNPLLPLMYTVIPVYRVVRRLARKIQGLPDL